MGNVFSDRYSRLGRFDVPPPPRPLFGFRALKYFGRAIFACTVVICVTFAYVVAFEPHNPFYALIVAITIAAVMLGILWMVAARQCCYHSFADNHEFQLALQERRRLIRSRRRTIRRIEF